MICFIYIWRNFQALGLLRVSRFYTCDLILIKLSSLTKQTLNYWSISVNEPLLCRVKNIYEAIITVTSLMVIQKFKAVNSKKVNSHEHIINFIIYCLLAMCLEQRP